MSGQLPISAIVLTKDEAPGIVRCVERLADFDDVIVVDSLSTDGTPQLAEAAGARVVDFVWNGAYPKKKQWSLDHAGARHDWVLLLDADEAPTAALVTELRTLLPELRARSRGAYDIRLRYKFAGRFLDHGHTVVKRSLVDRTAARFPEIDDLDAPGIREVEGHYQPQTERGIGRVKGRIEHDDVDPIASWFERHNRYSGWEAHLRARGDARREVASRRSAKGRLFDRVPFKPLSFFAYSYLLKAGFLDGRAGFDYAVALSTYYWQIGVKYRELRRQER
ncbi:glycosyltransferase family 2 protein [Demequina activiva]|uniref:Glycosyl transferase family 2 n=1 Tax=Demequina activiva TaxID=1582364 RepID=A0A919UFT7_9MICO|nr:glycosyltransferase family 2 protein [Demequina activiva]GIG53784.1 glycosyl transferase family 2 [Demequina activiva]